MESNKQTSKPRSWAAESEQREPLQRRQREKMLAEVKRGSRQKLVRRHALQVGVQVLQEVACKKIEHCWVFFSLQFFTSLPMAHASRLRLGLL